MEEEGTSSITKGRRGLLLASCIVAMAALPASASALTYCVSDPACVSAGGTNMGSNLQAALTAAQGNGGPDRVQIGPGDFLSAGTGFAYNAGATNPVEIDGAGSAQTTLRAPTPPAATPAVTLAVLGAAPAHSVSDLAVVIPGSLPLEFETNTGIRLPGGGTIERVDVSIEPTALNAVGIFLAGTLRDSTIEVGNGSGRPAVRVLDASVGTIEDSVLKGFYGVYGDANGATATLIKISRVEMESYYGIYSQASNVTVEDSLITIPEGAGTVGITAMTGPLVDASTIVRNSTIVGNGTSAQTGVDAEGFDAGRTVTVNVNSSTITGFSTGLRRDGAPGTAHLSTSYTNRTGLVDSSGAGALVNGAGNTGFASPAFVNAAAGDYALSLSSPLRDIGDPAALAGGESVTDLGGDPRIAGGRRDMGAFEFKTSSVKCAGKPATRVGTNGNDTLAGTAGADVIVALAGKDVVRGLAANDVACGGAGNDRLIGGAGKDLLLGEAGRDVLRGGARRDVLKGGPGRDRMVGGRGRDKLRGGPGLDLAIQ